MTPMAMTQDASGNALEYAVASQFATLVGVPLAKDDISEKARKDFMSHPADERLQLSEAAMEGVLHVIALESPLALKNSSEVKMQPDMAGQAGDPRDILLSLRRGHLGVSVKRNNNVEKNQRLQRNNPDFGDAWGLDATVSECYKTEVEKVFQTLDEIRGSGVENWRDIPDKSNIIYAPLLEAFGHEFALMAKSPQVCKKFTHYVVGGAFDYYKIMAYPKKVVVQAYNFGGTLSCEKQKPPKSLLSVARKDDRSSTTLALAFDGGWVFTMRIHNAASRIEDSLKWDVRMVSHPANVYAHHILL